MGAVKNVRVFATIAWVYHCFGYWPAVSSMLVLCVALPVLFAFKVHGLRSRQSTDERQQPQ
jgi:hypothetical protein